VVRRACARLLIADGCEALTAASLAEGAALLGRREPVVLVAEAELAIRAKADKGSVQKALIERAIAILLVDIGSVEQLEAAKGVAFAVLERTDAAPFGLALLVTRAREQALRGRSGENDTLGSLVTSSRAMRAVVARIPSFADARSGVLLLGEPGVGKRAIARLIHERGIRQGRPFVTVGLLEPTLGVLETALRLGAENAASGSLLLDRIDALDERGQALLLRFLREDRAARVIATALPTFREQGSHGKPARDLYVELSSHVVDLPRLADRPDDIAVLAQVFARRTSARLGLGARRFSPEALRVLRGADWEGNIPELEARVEAAIAAGGTGSIAMGDLGFSRAKREPPEGVEPYSEAKDRTVAEFDQVYVENVLAFSGGNVTRAAHLAGMDRANFRRLAKRTKSRG